MLVTAAAGFFVSHTAAELASQDDRVVGISDLPSASADNLRPCHIGLGWSLDIDRRFVELRCGFQR